MGIDSDAYLVFGINLGEDAELPWYGDDCEGDEEGWWRDIKGFSPSVIPDWLADKSEEREAAVNQYFEERQAFDEANPLPVEVVTHCSDYCPMIILGVKGTYKRAWRGDPVEIDPDELKTPDPKQLLDFCKEFGIEFEGEPKWLLCSYMG